MAIIPPVIVVMEKACRSAAKGLVRDFGEIEKLQISKKDKNDFVSSADLKASQTISYNLEKDRPDFLQIDEESYSDQDAEKLQGDQPVFVFDPLAISLVIAANFMFSLNSKNKERDDFIHEEPIIEEEIIEPKEELKEVKSSEVFEVENVFGDIEVHNIENEKEVGPIIDDTDMIEPVVIEQQQNNKRLVYRKRDGSN